MRQFLTQQQIDGLLKGLSLVEKEDQVLPFEVGRKTGLSIEQQDACDALFRKFAEGLAAQFSGRLAAVVDVRFKAAETVLMSQFADAIGPTCSAYLFEAGHGRRAAVDLPPEAVFLILDLLFGGPGDSIPERRPLTSLEQEIGREAVERMLPVLTEAFHGGVPFAPAGLTYVTEPDAVDVARPGDSVLAAYFDLLFGEQQIEIAFALPIDLLESMTRRATPETGLREASQEQTAVRDLIAANIRHARVEIKAQMPAFRMSARDLTRVAPGQVLLSGHAVDTAVELHVNGRLSFIGSLGQARRQIGVRIAETASAREAERNKNEKQGRIL